MESATKASVLPQFKNLYHKCLQFDERCSTIPSSAFLAKIRKTDDTGWLSGIVMFKSLINNHRGLP